MLQIVIWGMCVMLIVKGVEIMHSESVAQNANHGALIPAILACILAFGGAVALFVLGAAQASSSAAVPDISSFGTR